MFFLIIAFLRSCHPKRRHQKAKQRGNEKTRQCVDRVDLFDASRRNTNGHNHDATGGAHITHDEIGEHRAEQTGEERQRTLINDDDNSRKSDANPQRGTKHNGHDAIKHRFCKKNAVILVQSGLKRADDRHSTDAKEQTRADEAIDKTGIVHFGDGLDANAKIVQMPVR